MSWPPFNSLVCWQITLTLLHVSWIGLVIGLIAAFGNRVLRDKPSQRSRHFPSAAALQRSEGSQGADGTRSVPATLNANRRYWLNFASLLLFAASLPVTFAIVRSVTADVESVPEHEETLVAELANLTPPVVGEPAFFTPPTDAVELPPNVPQSVPSAKEVPAVVLPPIVPSSPSTWERVSSIGRAAAPFIAILYAIGVALMFVKLAFGVRVSRRLRSASQPISDATILARMAAQTKKLSLRITPVIAYCEHTAVPIVVGLLRPMILIPTAMINGLTIEQLESVLTHELAHLRRRDHLMIVAQRVLEAILFFHPVTWYLSHRLHDDRETSCDDLVLSFGCDRIQYAQSLLRVAELRLADKSHQKHIALAADGQRPSKLRQRISRLLGDHESDSVRVSSVWLVIILVGTFIGGICTLAATRQPTVASFADEARIKTKESRKLIHQALASVRSIKTAHVKFRIARPGFDFKKNLDAKNVRQLIEDNDLVRNPGNLPSLLESLVSDASQLGDKPWSNVDLYQEGKRVRTTTSSTNHGPDEYVKDEVLSLRWDSANWQMNVTPIAKERYYQETLSEFLVPNDDLLNGSADSVSMFRYLEQFRGEGSSRSIATDPNTGNVQSVTIFHGEDEVKTESLRLGWKKYNDQIWFPTVVAELNYENGKLSRCEFIIIEHAVFNKSLPVGIFQLGAAAGSVIVDNRGDAVWARKINGDVLDVASVEQVQAALEPLSKELTNEEVAGVAEATRLYTLNEGTALKRISPPFPLARKYVSRMLGDRSAHRPRELSRLINWNGTKFESYHIVDGGTFAPGHLGRLLTSVGPAELEGDTDLLKLSIPGDFVFREGANREDLLRDLQEIVAGEARTPVKIEFRNVERTVFRATGELKLNLPEGRSQVAMNGGPHTGDFGESISGGNANSLLLSLSAYIRTKIINEVTAPNDRFEWSERWYDLDSTKPEDRFHLDPAVVLRQINQETGIKFTEEKQVVPVLFIQRVNAVRSTAGNTRSQVESTNADTNGKSLTGDDSPQEDTKPDIRTLWNSNKPIQIVGHVRDVHGKPVSGANVSHPVFANGDVKSNRTQADAEGQFELNVTGKDLSVYPNIWVWHEAYSLATPSLHQFTPGTVEHAKPEVILQPESLVKFRIERPDGKSLKNANVYPAEMRIPNGTEPVDGMAGLYSFLPDDELKKFATRTTNEHGEVELPHVSVDVLSGVGVATDEFGVQEFDIRSLTGPKRLTMEPVGRMIGTAPPGTRIEIQSRRASETIIGEGRANVVADEGGHFEVKAIARGRVTITPYNSEDSEWLMEEQLVILEPASTVTIEFVPQATIPATGRLVHADSKLPIANARVAVQVGSMRTWLGRVVTDTDGKFTSRCLPGKQFVAQVIQLPEATMLYPKPTQSMVQVPVDSKSFELPDIEIRTIRIGKGKLVDANNNPIAGQYVQHYFDNKAIDHPSRTDDNGEFAYVIDKEIITDRWAAVLKWNLRDKSGNAGYANDRFEVEATVISEDPLVLQIQEPEPSQADVKQP